MPLCSSNSDDQSKSARSKAPLQLDLLEQCKLLAKGVYGLPEAVADIHALKTKLAALSENRTGKQHSAFSCWPIHAVVQPIATYAAFDFISKLLGCAQHIS